MKVEETEGALLVRTGRPVVSIVLGVAAVATGAAMMLTLVGPGMSTRGIVAASATVVALLGAAWMLGENPVFHLSKEDDSFSWRHERTGRGREATVPLGDVAKARRQVLKDTEGDTYRLIVETARGEVPLTKSFGSRMDEIVEAADRINRFLGHSDR